MAKFDMSNMFPWNKMKSVTVDGQAMVFLPKIWIRNTPLPKGTKYEDKAAYMFADGPEDGYHLAPSFYTNGVQNENGVQYLHGGTSFYMGCNNYTEYGPFMLVHIDLSAGGNSVGFRLARSC